MHIGLKIKELCEAKNISVADLSKNLGKSRQAIYDILEKKHISTELIESIANFLDTPMYIFFIDDKEKIENLSSSTDYVSQIAELRKDKAYLQLLIDDLRKQLAKE